MKRPFGFLGPEFGPFLYASVGDEGNGMNLSVLSTLARRDLDPWKEAAELATLPVDAAARRLASLIAGLPGAAGSLEARGAANRLVLLLPKQANPTIPRSDPVIGIFGMTKSLFVVWIVVISLIMGTQAIQASRVPPAQTKKATEAATVLAPPTKGPLPVPGQ